MIKPEDTFSIILNKVTIENKRIVAKDDLLEDLFHDELEVLLTLGAGDIDVFVPQIKEQLNNKFEQVDE